jgi:hypothetical protein
MVLEGKERDKGGVSAIGGDSRRDVKQPSKERSEATSETLLKVFPLRLPQSIRELFGINSRLSRRYRNPTLPLPL